MRVFIMWLLAVSLGLGQEAKPERTIKDFEGRWLSGSLSEMMLQGVAEIGAEIQSGDLDYFSPGELAEFETEVGKPLKDFTAADWQALLPISGLKSEFAQTTHMGIEITADSRFSIFMMLDSEKLVALDEPAEFTLTDTGKEIVYRTESESGLILIEGDTLKMENEKEPGYPKYIRYKREEPSGGS